MYQLIVESENESFSSEHATLEKALLCVDIALKQGARDITLWYNEETLIEYWIGEDEK